jgi:hypothetical protein
VLSELAGEDEADGGLDLARGDGGLLVVARELGGLSGELLEDVVDEGVHDGHGLGGDADVGVHLLQHLEDVDLVGLDALLRPPLALLVAAALLGRRLARRQPLLGLGLLPCRSLLRLLSRRLLRGLLRRRLLLRLGRHGCRSGSGLWESVGLAWLGRIRFGGTSLGMLCEDDWRRMVGSGQFIDREGWELIGGDVCGSDRWRGGA